MKLILILALLSTSVLAQEKCRSSVEKQLPTGSKLLKNKAVVLNPGEDYPYMMGEIWNDQKEPLEYYGVSTSNGYYAEYLAVGASLRNCKIMREIEIGDSLDE